MEEKPRSDSFCSIVIMYEKHEKTSSFLLSKEDINEILTQAPPTGKKMLEPLKHIADTQHLPFNVIELTEHTNKVEVHKYVHDLWFCLEGEVKFFCGGTMQEPYTHGTLDETELRAKGLEAAKEIVVRQGDWLWIPAGEPHQHITKNTARLMIIKVPCS